MVYLTLRFCPEGGLEIEAEVIEWAHCPPGTLCFVGVRRSGWWIRRHASISGAYVRSYVYLYVDGVWRFGQECLSHVPVLDDERCGHLDLAEYEAAGLIIPL